jgi:flagellar biosynthesis protein FlhF
MREALAQVKLEQGADAVILGNKKVPGGVEILSAIDFDHRQVDAYTGTPSMPVSEPVNQQPWQQAQTAREIEQLVPVPPQANTSAAMPDFILDQNSEGRKEPVLGMQATVLPMQPKAPPAQPARSAQAEPVARSNYSTSQASPKARPTTQTRSRAVAQSAAKKPAVKKGLPVEEEALARARQADQLLHSLREKEYNQRMSQSESQPVIDEVKDELKNLRDLMASQLNVLEWDRFSQRHPVRSVLLNLMTELGLGSDVCEMIFEKLGVLSDEPHKVWQTALGLLASSIPIADNDILVEGGRIALVGSTGVGKTTTIAKLAARFAHTHGKRSVAMISTDTFRVGAQEQLQHFARLLEIPLLSANNSEELTDSLKMLADKHLVLIDTAGMSQTDVRLVEQFHKLQHGSPEIQPYLVLSANTQLAALNATVKSFARVKLGGTIVTKIDESASLGGIITAAIRHQLPISYCGTGQRVPEDLQMAKNHRLVSKAVSLMQNYTEQVDKETLAFRYNHLISTKKG